MNHGMKALLALAADFGGGRCMCLYRHSYYCGIRVCKRKHTPFSKELLGQAGLFVKIASCAVLMRYSCSVVLLLCLHFPGISRTVSK